MTHSFARWLAAGAVATAMLALTAPVQAGNYTDRGDSYQAAEPMPWRGSAKDDEGYPVPQAPPREYHQSYKDDGAPPPRRTAECLSKFGIRGALNEQGWHAFDGVELRGRVAFMTARNDDGRRFELQVDSCTGAVIEAHPAAVYYETPPPRYYEPRPAVGLYFYGGGHRHWR